MKRKFYVFMALLSGLIFGLSVYYYLQTMNTAPPTETKSLVVAAADIPARSLIQESQLQIIQTPVDGYPQGGASQLKDVAGKVLLVNLGKDDVVLSPMLQEVPAPDRSGRPASDSFSFTVPKDKRAMAVPVSLAGGVNFQVKPGDRVDVLITLDIKNEDGDTLTITSLAAQDVLVLNTGATMANDSEKAQTSSYILALSVSQAMSVTLGSERGSVRLLLRNPVNQEIYSEVPFDPSKYLNPDYFSHYK